MQPTLARTNPMSLFAQTDVGVELWAGRRNFDVSADGQQFILAHAVGSTGETQASPRINVVLNWIEELKERVPIP